MTDSESPTAMTFPVHEDGLVTPEREQQIIDAICRARDADIKRQFDTYGTVFPYTEDMWLRAVSRATVDVFGVGERSDVFGASGYGREWREKRDIVQVVFEKARAERRLWTRII